MVVYRLRRTYRTEIFTVGALYRETDDRRSPPSRSHRVGPCYVSVAAVFSFQKTVFSSLRGSLLPLKSPL